MPLYEYQCKKCGHRFERILQSFSTADVKECPVCQGEVERLLSAPAVQFKGSGFYSTDYAAKPTAKQGQASDDGKSKPATDGAAAPSEKSSPAKTETTASSSTDKASKPAG